MMKCECCGKLFQDPAGGIKRAAVAFGRGDPWPAPRE